MQRTLAPDAPVVAAGSGVVLAREVAAQLGREVADPPVEWGDAASAVALAMLAARRC